MPNALGGVLDQVDQYLFDLLWINPNPNIRWRFQDQLNGGFFQLPTQQSSGSRQQAVSRNRDQLRLDRAGELQKGLNDTFQALDLPIDNRRILELGRTFDQRALE